ncbi:uncharacterized protein LOC142335996 isoform X2 [Convolutriloba macropyga]|uniref:uncharacterized protein LOC142335996 isoform X2 n=1 Tax=Convolutriloba macropyga TaxID=536237 RepID=UPI003F51D13F
MHHIQINNRFADLEFDDENEENVESKKIVEKKEKDVKKETKKPPKSNANNIMPPKAVQQSEKPPPKSQSRAPVGNQPAQEKSANVAPDDSRKPPRPPAGGNGGPPSGGFGGNRTTGGGGGGGGGFGTTAFSNSNAGNRQSGPRPAGGFDNRGGKREFDRKSGSEKTSVRGSDKREGAGPHNWGNSIKDFTTETFAPPADAEAETDEKKPTEEKTGDENAPVGEGGEVGGEAEPQETPVMSLDEYMNQKEKAKSGMPQLQIRKAGEGEGSFNSGVKVIKKLNKKETQQEGYVKIQVSGSGRERNILPINFQPMGNRGGRGGSRGGGGRGRGQMRERGEGRDYPGPNQPNIEDESAFPSLS